MTKNSVVVVVNRCPIPADDGFKVRVTALLDALADRTPVNLLINDVLSGTQRELMLERWPSWTVRSVPGKRRTIGAASMVSIFRSQPYHVTLEDTRDFRALLRENISEGDTVVAESIGIAALVLKHTRASRVFVDTHNIDSEVLVRYSRALPSKILRTFSFYSARLMEAVEASVFGAVTEVWVCSNREENDLRDRGYENVICVPNGVSISTPAEHPEKPEGVGFVFFGRLDYRPNIDALHYFADEIAPLVMRSNPEFSLRVIGAGDTSAIRKILAGKSWARITGRVENVADSIRGATAVLVPLRIGGGTRLKVLEAMAAGVPVISTSLGAEGIDYTADTNILIADSAPEFERMITLVNNDSSIRARLGNCARDLVRSKYMWSETLGPHVERLLNARPRR